MNGTDISTPLTKDNQGEEIDTNLQNSKDSDTVTTTATVVNVQMKHPVTKRTHQTTNQSNNQLEI